MYSGRYGHSWRVAARSKIHSSLKKRVSFKGRSAPKPRSASKPRRAKTQTKTLTTKLDQGMNQISHNYSTSRYNFGTKKTNLLGRVLKEFSHSNYNRVVPLVLNGSVGRQAIVDFVGIDEYDLGQIKTQVDLMSQNGPSSGQVRTQKIMLRDFQYELSLKNMSTDVCRLDIYDIAVRRDIGYDLTDPANYRNTPTRAFLEGLSDQINTPSTSTFTVVGQVPFDSKQFTSFYKVRKITHVTLDPGGLHSHRVSGKPNFFYNDTLREGTANKVVAWKGLSVYTLIVAWGSPAVDSTGLNVTTENAQIGIIQNKRVTYSWAYSNINFTSYQNGLGATLRGTDNFVNPDIAQVGNYDTVI